MAQPSREAILEICAIVPVDEAGAKILLKKNNNDANSAVNAWFEYGEKALETEPAPSTAWEYQDNVPFQEDSNMGGVQNMSRPPSRIDLDLTADHATATASNVKSLREQQEENDPELQRAMAESLKPNQPAQENGTIQAGSHFGPAKQGFNYESSNWAMTTYSTSREIIEHPPPSKRRRIGEAPAFLRGSKDTGYLGSLLTIYHNIPLACEALLMPAFKVHAYAHDSNWWSGATDENNKAMSNDNTLQIDQNERNVLAEVQCLMAFLDETTRAYGSVDALTDLQALRSQGGDNTLHKFFEAWGNAALKQAPQEPLTQVFCSTATKPNGETVVDKTFSCVEPYVNHHPDETLTDMLDITIWDDTTPGVMEDVWISHCAEVFTVRVQEPTATTRKLDLTLEPTWYVDRYLYECREEMQQIRRQFQTTMRQVQQLTHMQRRCQMFNSGKTNQVLDATEVLTAAVKASGVAASKLTASDGFLDGRQAETENAVSPSDLEELNSELQSVLQKIRHRSEQLELRKAELHARSRQVTKQLTKPTAERPDVPNHKYTLQGVATGSGVTYFRRRNPNPDLLEAEELDENGTDYEWWRSSWKQQESPRAAHPPLVGPVTQAQAEAAGTWSSDAAIPWSIERVSEADVLEAAKNEYNTILLVYANDHALNFQRNEAPGSLRQFVEHDNRAYAEDLLEESGPLQEASADHEVDTEFEDVPLIDPARSNSSLRELTPMSTSSPDHDEEEQPSLEGAKEDISGDPLEHPPPYEDTFNPLEMQEKKENKIGLYAEQLLQRYGNAAEKKTEDESNS